ncbi:YopT-type cysteine protease domain-containing protein [Paraburkholderia aromaticivorans]|uniref:Peptidase C58 YopT-type domain-containing protein n=1 Tax=Paraburkholderia aromaticivorans TaxID=2026199 RepID=A0A248VX12_9BURK|nr:YopT-type cysteine protease domain-containing protein [Paraburkholderia aromaticivorans]ASW03528.1 hypothetical protein CJU94_35845 [Paraburkholderia aromaticivorans]
MEQPTFVFRQNDLLRGMTSDLAKGACWGLSVKWLRDCFSGGPSVAGLGITHGLTASEGLKDHAQYGNQFLSNSSDDNNLSNGIVMLSQGRLDGERDTDADNPVAPGMLSLGRAMSISATLTKANGNYFGMVIFACSFGRHAMAVTKWRNVWALFDPNFGTWTYVGDSRGGAPAKFATLLKDNFDTYKVTDVKLLKIKRLFTD